jgi:hypothetical protein
MAGIDAAAAIALFAAVVLQFQGRATAGLARNATVPRPGLVIERNICSWCAMLKALGTDSWTRLRL